MTTRPTGEKGSSIWAIATLRSGADHGVLAYPVGRMVAEPFDDAMQHYSGALPERDEPQPGITVSQRKADRTELGRYVMVRDGHRTVAVVDTIEGEVVLVKVPTATARELIEDTV